MDYDKVYFQTYLDRVINELNKRSITHNIKLYDELLDFTNMRNIMYEPRNYPEHNDRYIRECIYNLEEKAIRGIITKDEWMKIYDKFKDFTELWNPEKEKLDFYLKRRN